MHMHIHIHIDNQFNSFHYLSLGDSSSVAKTNLLLIDMMYYMLQRQMEVLSISSISELKSKKYLRIEVRIISNNCVNSR